MATNTYTYGSLGQRWTIGEPTSKALLDLSRTKADANRWTLQQLVTDPDNDANFALSAATGTFSSTLGVTGLITASGGVSGNISGNVTGGTISGSTGTFSDNVAVSKNGGADTELSIYNNSSSASAKASLKVGYDSSNHLHIHRVGNAAGIIYNATQSGSSHQFQIAGSSKVTLDATGWGVGTVSPSALIHAEAADGAAGGAIKYTATGVASGYLSASPDGTVLATDTAGISFRTGINSNDPTDTGTEVLNINSSGVAFFYGAEASFGADTNNRGIVNYGSNVLALSTVQSGTTYYDTVKITDGKVGIGTAPTCRLDLSGAGGGDPTGAVPAGGMFVRVTDTATVGEGAVLRLQSTNGSKETAATIAAVHTSGNNGDLTFGMYAGGADHPERMRLSSSGNLTIQNTSTDSNPFFKIKNDAREYNLQVAGARADNFEIYDNTAGTQRLTILSDGKTGIGTTSPTATLTVQAHSNTIHVQKIQNTAGNVVQETYVDGSGNPVFNIRNSAGQHKMQFSTYESSFLKAGFNFGLGTSSPSRTLHLSSTAGTFARFTSENSDDFSVGANNNGFVVYNETDSTYPFTIVNNGVAAFTIADINVLFNGTTSSRLLTDNNGVEIYTGGYIWAARQGTSLYLSRSGAAGEIANFRFNAATSVGSISVTSSATAFNTSSDYRLKENLSPITSAVDRVNALNPQRFNFINSPDVTVDGFVAHEVSLIVPEAITGTKDAVDDDGEPIYQGIDQSKLVPLLTAAIQELTARIETLENA